MTVKKSTRECYEVRANHEWANITLRSWDNPPPDGSTRGMYYCGEIVINSSFGVWGNTWTACGVPFKRFLIGAGFDYLFTKFMGLKLDLHDGAATLKEIKRDIIKARRTDGLDKERARDAWDRVIEEDDRIGSNDQTAYGYAMWDIGSRIDDGHPMHNYFNDPSSWPRPTRYDSGAAGFWRELWPEFAAALRAEIEQPVSEAA